MLLEAAKIDPESKEVGEALLNLKYQKVNGKWSLRKSQQTAASPSSDDPEPLRPALANSSLRGSTPDEVRTRLGGEPGRKAWSASQGQVIEQWIYYTVDRVHYVNFSRTAGETRPKVVAFYSRPRTPADPPSSH